MIKKSLSKWLFLATMTIHEEPPRWFRTIQKTKALAVVLTLSEAQALLHEAASVAKPVGLIISCYTVPGCG